MNLYEYQRSRSFIDIGSRSLRFNIFKLLFLRNRLADWIQISCGSSMGWRNESLFTWPRWPPCSKLGKNILLLWNQKADDLESWYAASGTRVLPGMFKWWPGLTLTYFMARSSFFSYAFVWEDGKTMDFSEIVVCDLSWQMQSTKWVHEPL